jgi:hypothetical protein
LSYLYAAALTAEPCCNDHKTKRNFKNPFNIRISALSYNVQTVLLFFWGLVFFHFQYQTKNTAANTATPAGMVGHASVTGKPRGSGIASVRTAGQADIAEVRFDVFF